MAAEQIRTAQTIAEGAGPSLSLPAQILEHGRGGADVAEDDFLAGVEALDLAGVEALDPADLVPGLAVGSAAMAVINLSAPVASHPAAAVMGGAIVGSDSRCGLPLFILQWPVSLASHGAARWMVSNAISKPPARDAPTRSHRMRPPDTVIRAPPGVPSRMRGSRQT